MANPVTKRASAAPALVAWLLACAFLVVMIAPKRADAFSIEAHRTITHMALQRSVDGSALMPPTDDELARFYLWLDQTLASAGQDKGRRAFRARFQRPEDFDARAVRRFLGFGESPEFKVFAISGVEHTSPVSHLALLVAASAYPDIDQRNRSPLLYDDDGQVVRLADGRPVPYDPMALNMGGPEGLASQAHAHYALPGALTPTVDAEVLRNEPWRFAIATACPGPVETFADEMAQAHLDMAILARRWGESEHVAAARYLAAVWLGAGLHYIQDAAGPLHNVQVGSYLLFARAKKAWYLRALLSGGGFLCELPSFVSMGIGLLRNHHLLAERWLATQLAVAAAGGQAHPAIATALAAADDDEPALALALELLPARLMKSNDGDKPELDGRGVGSVLVEQLALIGSRQGGDLYDAIAVAAAPAVAEVGYELPDEGTVTADLLRDPAAPEVAAAMERMATIHAASLRRALTASRRYVQAWRQGQPSSAALRLRRSRLRYMAAAQSRREAWVKSPPPAASETAREPLWLAAVLALAALLAAAATRIFKLARARPRIAITAGQDVDP